MYDWRSMMGRMGLETRAGRMHYKVKCGVV